MMNKILFTIKKKQPDHYKVYRLQAIWCLSMRNNISLNKLKEKIL